MYQPAHARFVETDSQQLQKLIRDYPLGTLLTQRSGETDVTYTPFLANDASLQSLTAHVPRANPVWQGLDGQKVLILFHGPNAYISPSWYPSKHVHGKAVPTWNYAVVHVQGTVRVIEDTAWLRTHIDELTTRHEHSFAHPWKVSDAPNDYIERLVQSIVGLEVTITNVEGKFKLGQSRPPGDQLGVLAGLTATQSPLAKFVTEYSRTK